MILGHANITTCQIERELRFNNVERGFGAIFVLNPTALVLHLKYILNLLAAFQQYSKYSYCIPTTFELHSGANAQEYARIIPGWFEVVERHSLLI